MQKSYCVNIFILAFSLFIQLTEAQQSIGFPKVNIPGSELRTVKSTIIGDEYDLYINLPRFYNDTTKHFPVVYLLDAQWDFALVSSIFGEQYYDGFVPGFIIVGITWKGDNVNYDSLRARYLSPSNIPPVPHSGNASTYLASIKNEIVPFIESNYRTIRNDRTLMGSSFGGIFTLYALFNETGLFNKYVLTSPAIGWDNEVIYSIEQKYFEKKSDFSAKLFMAQGELEGGVPRFQKFADHLKNRKYKGLQIQSRILEHIGHSGTKAEGYTRGLQFVFERPEVVLSMKTLQQYVGTYQINPQMEVKVSVEGKNLVAYPPGSDKLVFHPINENEFYVKGAYLQLHITRDDLGKVSGARLEQYAGEINLKKVN